VPDYWRFLRGVAVEVSFHWLKWNFWSLTLYSLVNEEQHQAEQQLRFDEPMLSARLSSSV